MKKYAIRLSSGRYLRCIVVDDVLDATRFDKEAAQDFIDACCKHPPLLIEHPMMVEVITI